MFEMTMFLADLIFLALDNYSHSALFARGYEICRTNFTFSLNGWVTLVYGLNVKNRPPYAK